MTITADTFNSSPEALEIIERLILEEYDNGANRISVKKHIELVRDRYGLTINNTDSTAIADYMIETYPDLQHVIEIRNRPTAKLPPNTHPDVRVLHAAFTGRKALTIKSVTVTSEDGETVTMGLAQLKQLFGK